MARFWKEFKYSLRMRKHIFFLLMVIMGLVSAVYLFRESLQSSLDKAFPGKDPATATEKDYNEYHIKGTYAEHATAKDVDIQAELTINRALHQQEWMKYEEGFLDEIYVKDYAGTDQAVVGYGTEKLDANKVVEMDKGKYGKVQSAWLSQELLDRYGLADGTGRMFSNSSYTDKLYVMLGAGFAEDTSAKKNYPPGTELTLRVEGVKVEAVVFGYMAAGATVVIGGETVNLNYRVICPLLDLSNLYTGEDPSDMPTNTDPLYLQESQIGSKENFKDTETSQPTMERSGTTYTAVKCLWLKDEDIDARMETMEVVPEWLKRFRKLKSSGTSVAAFFGNSYNAASLVILGKNLQAMTKYDGQKLVICNGFIPEGETYELDGKTINLDDYIVIGIKKNETATTDGENKSESGEGEKEAESGLQVEQRTLLFRLLVKKNSGLIRETVKTADEAEQTLEKILEGAWENYQKDNPKLERTSSYQVKEADEPGSVIYRENIREIPKKLTKIDSIGYFVCIVLLLLYLVYKFFKGSDYYTTLILTGNTKLEIILLFLAELAVLFVFACGLAFGLSWVVCKILGLGAVVIKPIISKNVRIIAIPFVIISVLIIIKDYGRIFRRR